MLNSTSESIEAGFLSSNNINEQCFASPSSPVQPAKRKRNLPGNPDPDADVVALSPRTLVATNRFICEVCNKGFQRDQNLQLHRRGHNLPWTLKKRTNKGIIKKKVYICPEPSCVHHDPFRALGDLTGIKKHFSRKHGEKKWKCEKCSKRYAVKSDWKAHSKICGTREYRCDCGTLFSRRDSFITHRAFCDVLVQETRTASTAHPNLHDLQPLLISLKSEQELEPISFNLSPEMPQWLPDPSIHPQQNPNPNPTTITSNFHVHSPHMLATSLLQKAAQMGVTRTEPCDVDRGVNSMRQFVRNSRSIHSEFIIDTNLSEGSHVQIAQNILRPHQSHMNANGYNISTSLATREDIGAGFIHDDLASFGNINNNNNTINSLLASTSEFQESDIDDTMNGFLNQRSDGGFPGMLTKSAGSNFSGSGQDGLTRDFLGLRGFPQRDFINMAGIEHLGSSSNNHQKNQNPPPWLS